MRQQRYHCSQVHYVKAPNGEFLQSWTKKKKSGSDVSSSNEFTLGIKYPGTRGRNQAKEPKEITEALKKIQCKRNWEAIKEKYGEQQATWVWRWYFTKPERNTLADFMSGKVEQGELGI